VACAVPFINFLQLLFVSFLYIFSENSFLYVACSLAILKVYHTRHANESPSAFYWFPALAGVILLEAFAVVSESYIVRLLVFILHIVTSGFLFARFWKTRKIHLFLSIGATVHRQNTTKNGLMLPICRVFLNNI